MAEDRGQRWRHPVACGAVVVLAILACALLAHRTVARLRAARGAALFAAGDPVSAYPYLQRAAQAGWLSGLDPGPLLDLGDLALWAIDDPRFRRYHPDLTPGTAARLAFLSYTEALRRAPVSAHAMSGLADLLRRIETGPPLFAVGDQSTSGATRPRPGKASAPAAEAAYRRAVAMDPRSGRRLLILADYLEATGRRSEAMDLYGRAVELEPDLRLHPNYAEDGPLAPDLFATGVAGLERALQRGDGMPRDRILMEIGSLYEQQGDDEGALARYRQAIAAAPDPSRALSSVAVILDRQGRADEAEEYHRRAVARGTLPAAERAASLKRLGERHMERGELRAAVEALGKSRAADPGSYGIRLALGRALAAAGDDRGAEAELQQALAFDAERAEAYIFLIEIDRARGEPALAVPLARPLAELEPGAPAHRERLEALYREAGSAAPGR